MDASGGPAGRAAIMDPTVRTTRWLAARDDSDFAPYLAEAPPGTVELFRRFVAMARDCGPVSFELQRGRIVLCGSRRIFASVRPGRRGLSGHLNLLERVGDPRIVRVEPLTKRIFFHTYQIRSMSELNEGFRRWLCAARAVGEGT